MEHYQYFISVRVTQDKKFNSIRSLSSMLEVKPSEIKKIHLAENMKNNKLFKTTGMEAIKSVGVDHINSILNGLNLSAKANNETIHKFTMPSPIAGVGQVDVKGIVEQYPGVIGKRLKEIIEYRRLDLVRDWFEMIIGLSMKPGKTGEEYTKWLIDSKL